MLRRPKPKFLTERNIGAPNKICICGRGLGYGTQMQDCRDPVVLKQKFVQPFWLHEYSWRMMVEITPFLALLAQPVGNCDFLSFGRERRLEIRSDESGTARDQYHGTRYM